MSRVCPVVEPIPWTDPATGLTRLVSPCTALATEAVTAWHKNGGSETRWVCATHAPALRRQLAAEGVDRPPTSWIKGTRKQSRACLDCGKREDEGARIAARQRCWSCYRKARRAS